LSTSNLIHIMKTNLYFFILLITALSSCKKDISPVEEKISSDNPAAISKNIKVFHGERIQGVQPAPKGGNNAPSIDGPDGGSIIALAGKYAIIKPELLAGELAGYYISVTGANEYFKVDFTKPRILMNGREIKSKKRSSLFNTLRMDSTGNGNADSSIVFTLPPNIQTPDTICVTYSPYDAQGNIGQPVSTCIIVNHLGGDASTSWLQGPWTSVAFRDNGDSAWYTYPDNRIMQPSGPIGYYCDYDSIIGQNRLFQKECFEYGACTNVLGRDSTRVDKDDWAFNISGDMNYHYAETLKSVDISNSTCSQLNFTYPSRPLSNYIFYGAWSGENNHLTIIFEFNTLGVPDYDVLEYEITKISDNEFVLTYEDGAQTKFKRI
jgi:hypothetical protein